MSDEASEGRMVNVMEFAKDMFTEFSADLALGLVLMIVVQVKDGSTDDLLKSSEAILDSWKSQMNELMDDTDLPDDRKLACRAAFDEIVEKTLDKWQTLWQIRQMELVTTGMEN